MRNCPVCERNNADQPKVPESRDGWNLKRCADCSLVYLENPVSYEALQSEYRWAETAVKRHEVQQAESAVTASLASSWRTICRRAFYQNKCLRWIERYVSPGAVLDVGCGPGGLLAQLPAQYTPFGIEIDSKTAEKARERFAPRQGQVIVADGPSGMAQLPSGYFNGIVMKCYLEHETSPFEVLVEAKRVLRQNGVLIIKVPNYGSLNRRLRGANWPGYRFPDHVNYFDPDNLARLVSRAGFMVTRNNWRDHFPLNDNLYLMGEPREQAVNDSLPHQNIRKAA